MDDRLYKLFRTLIIVAGICVIFYFLFCSRSSGMNEDDKQKLRDVVELSPLFEK